MTTGEPIYLGVYRGQKIWITPDHATVWVDDGFDFAYPLDLNGSFRNWVARRI